MDIYWYVNKEFTSQFLGTPQSYALSIKSITCEESNKVKLQRISLCVQGATVSAATTEAPSKAGK